MSSFVQKINPRHIISMAFCAYRHAVYSKAVRGRKGRRTRSQLAAPQQQQHQHQQQERQSRITGMFSSDARYSKSKEALHLKQRMKREEREREQEHECGGQEEEEKKRKKERKKRKCRKRKKRQETIPFTAPFYSLLFFFPVTGCLWFLSPALAFG